MLRDITCNFVMLIRLVFVLSCQACHWSFISVYLLIAACDFTSGLFSSFLPEFCYVFPMVIRVEACLVTND